MSFADRWEHDLELRDAVLWDQHETGDHAEAAEPDCVRCEGERREALNREGQPEFNGAFSRW